MKRSPATWSTAIAAAALLAVPATGWAQASPSTPRQSVERPASTPTTQQESGQEHLRQAKDALNEIPEASLTGTAKSHVEELKRHISALESSAATAGQPSSSATAAQGNAAQASWSQDVAAIDRIVTEMLGTGSGTPGATGTTRAAPTTGRAESGAMLDEAAQAKLREVRTHITAFAGAMGSKNASGEQDSANASAPGSGASTARSSAAAQETPSASPESATPSSATPSSASPSTASASQEPDAPTASTPSAQGEAASAQPDPQAVKRHLTAARDTLSQLTQLPAAAQLTGEARTQVSQLITNFNQLITTNAAWRAEYAKVEANLDALLGNQRADESATTPAPGAGAVGTSGTVSLDPAIRAKLVEFRSHLMDFEKAAGGSAATSTPESGSTSGTAGTAGTTSATPPPSAAATSGSTGTSGATGTSGMSSSAERATGTSGTTTASSEATDAGEPQSSAAQTPPTASQASSQSSSQSSSPASTASQSQSPSSSQSQPAAGSEAMRHIAAIEAILNRGSSSASTSAPAASTSPGGESTATGTTGTATTGRTATAGSSSTLDRADIEQIRTHLNELRRVLTQGSSK